jgi:hypothetical protein
MFAVAAALSTATLKSEALIFAVADLLAVAALIIAAMSSSRFAFLFPLLTEAFAALFATCQVVSTN